MEEKDNFDEENELDETVEEFGLDNEEEEQL